MSKFFSPIMVSTDRALRVMIEYLLFIRQKSIINIFYLKKLIFKVAILDLKTIIFWGNKLYFSGPIFDFYGEKNNFVLG